MGTFRVYQKHITTTMDSSVADHEFELRDVPWVMYFKGSYALHAAYWHDDFGHVRSHGCVNLAPIVVNDETPNPLRVRILRPHAVSPRLRLAPNELHQPVTMFRLRCGRKMAERYARKSWSSHPYGPSVICAP